MIPRGASRTLHERHRHDHPHGWFLWWRVGLTRAWEAVVIAARSSGRKLRAIAARGRTSRASGVFTDLRGAALARAGIVGVVLGATVGIVVASPGTDRRAAALAGVASLMWMAIRWFGVRWAAPGIVAEDPAALRGAFALGLLPYSLAFTPELRLAAWFAAGAITGVTLLRIGRDRREVTRAIGFAWGIQACVVLGGWLARNAYIAVISATG